MAAAFWSLGLLPWVTSTATAPPHAPTCQALADACKLVLRSGATLLEWEVAALRSVRPASTPAASSAATPQRQPVAEMAASQLVAVENSMSILQAALDSGQSTASISKALQPAMLVRWLATIAGAFNAAGAGKLPALARARCCLHVLFRACSRLGSTHTITQPQPDMLPPPTNLPTAGVLSIGCAAALTDFVVRVLRLPAFQPYSSALAADAAAGQAVADALLDCCLPCLAASYAAAGGHASGGGSSSGGSSGGAGAAEGPRMQADTLLPQEMSDAKLGRPRLVMQLPLALSGGQLASAVHRRLSQPGCSSLFRQAAAVLRAIDHGIALGPSAAGSGSEDVRQSAGSSASSRAASNSRSTWRAEHTAGILLLSAVCPMPPDAAARNVRWSASVSEGSKPTGVAAGVAATFPSTQDAAGGLDEWSVLSGTSAQLPATEDEQEAAHELLRLLPTLAAALPSAVAAAADPDLGSIARSDCQNLSTVALALLGAPLL